MKTLATLSALAALSALGALVLLVPLSFEVILSAVFAAGLVGILVADYTHAFQPIPARAARIERLRLAA